MLFLSTLKRQWDVICLGASGLVLMLVVVLVAWPQQPLVVRMTGAPTASIAEQVVPLSMTSPLHDVAHSPKPRVQSSVPVVLRIAINTATEKEWIQLPGIGPKRAHEIIEFRQQHGNFHTVDELLNVKGIGPKGLEKIRPYLTL